MTYPTMRREGLLLLERTPLPAPSSSGLLDSDAQSGATSPVKREVAGSSPAGLRTVAQLAERLRTSLARFSLSPLASDAQVGATSCQTRKGRRRTYETGNRAKARIVASAAQSSLALYRKG